MGRPSHPPRLDYSNYINDNNNNNNNNNVTDESAARTLNGNWMASMPRLKFRFENPLQRRSELQFQTCSISGKELLLMNVNNLRKGSLSSASGHVLFIVCWPTDQSTIMSSNACSAR
jgi:hypothetical protein